MPEFQDALEEALITTARREHRRRPREHRRSIGFSRRTVVAGGAAVSAALIALVVGLPSGSSPTIPSAEAFAIFRKPAVDVSSLRVLEGRASAGIDVKHARKFATPTGTGYILRSSNGQRICMTIPDSPDGWGGTCVSRREAETKGLVGELIAPEAGAAPTQVNILLPVGTTTATLDEKNGPTRPMRVVDGIATTVVTKDATIRYATASGTQTLRERAVEPQGDYYVDCGDGRPVIRVDGVKDTFGAGYARACKKG